MHGSVIRTLLGQYTLNQVKTWQFLDIETYFFDGLTAGIATKNARNQCKLFATYYSIDPMPIFNAKVSHKLDFKGRPELGSAVDRKIQWELYCLSP